VKIREISVAIAIVILILSAKSSFAQDFHKVSGFPSSSIAGITNMSDGRVVVACQNGEVFVAKDNSNNEFEKWHALGQNIKGVAVQLVGDTTVVGDEIILLAENGKMFVIRDGNQKNEIEIQGAILNDIKFVPVGGNSGVVYVVGNSSKVYKSTDGCKIFQEQSTTYKFDHFYDIFFSNSTNGWIVGSGGIIYKTTNGGIDWNYVEGDHSNPKYNAVAFSGEQTGYVVGSSGSIFKTTNQGANWSNQNSGVTVDLNEVLLNPILADSDYVPVAVGNNGTLISDSNLDGNWEKTSLGITDNLYEVTSDKSGYIWIGGENGSVYTNKPTLTKPNAPSELSVTNTTSNRVDLSWKDNSDNESGFIIERKEGNDVFAPADSDAVNTTVHEDKNLKPNTEYSYRVSSYNAAGVSNYSNEVKTKTLNTAPSAPTDLTATPKSSSQIDLSWLDNSSNESGFIIERKEGNDVFVPADSDAVNTTVHEDKNLKPNTEYYYRVASYNEIGKSVYSNEVSAKTSDAAPLAPTGLKTTVVNGSQIDLSWYDNASNEIGYKVERKTGQNPFAEIVTLNTNTTTHSDKNLDDGLNYIYRVAAYNSINKSGYSNESSATTLLNSPTNLTVKKNSSGAAQLDWKDNSKSESGFTIEKKTGNGSFDKLIDVAANSNTYSDAQVSVGQQLSYRVQAFNSIIASTYSNSVEIIITSVGNENSIPTEYSLKQNFPNPFNPETIIKYDLPKGGYVALKIYDMLGCEILTLVNEYQNAGSYQLKCSANQLNAVSGLYLYKLSTSGYSSVKKMLLIK